MLNKSEKILENSKKNTT